MNNFDITGRIGYNGQQGNRRTIVIYHRAKVGEGQYEQQRIPLAAFGPKADELAQYAVGQVVALGGFVRPTEHGLELVVMRHAPAAQALPSTPAAEESAPEPVAEAQPEPVTQARPKARRRSRKTVG
jgi:hypothetical protein